MTDRCQVIRNTDVLSHHAAHRSRLLLVLAITFGVASLADALFLAENDTAMTRMMNGMTIKATGSIDREFVATMVPHHQGAIDMAESELRYGHNETLLRIAQEIIVELLQEIAAMRIAVGDKVSSYEAMLAATVPGSPAEPTPATPHVERLRGATAPEQIVGRRQ